MQPPGDALAENLRYFRERCGLSLDEVAQLTQVSKSMLRQIETGKSSPTISTLWKIADGLRVPLWSLLKSRAVRTKVRPIRAEESLSAKENFYRDYLVIPFSPQQPSEIHFLEMESQAFFKGQLHYPPVIANLFLISGSLHVIIENEEYKVEAGEVCRFQADRTHYFRIGDEMATAILQVCYEQKL